VASSSSTDDAHLVARSAAADVVGRGREVELVVAALDVGRHVLLEGPPGTGKSTLLRAVAEASGVGFTFVEGNAELTPARLVGQFDPALVLAKGYKRKAFVDGPLAVALRAGGLLYVEEINRVPEETLNVLVTVMSEGAIEVPRYGPIAAEPGFRLVAAMNPFDAVGTARISGAIYDRVCRIAMGYQCVEDEREIVERALPDTGDAPGSDWVARAVDAVRATRTHADLRVGSSVRGAIDAALVAASLARLRGVPAEDPTVGVDAALVALSGRVRVREGCARSAEEIVEEIWRGAFREPGKAGAPAGANAAG
jgi:MoxR-like ATPase